MGRVEEGGVSLILSSHPIHPAAGHLLEAVPSARCCVPRRRFGACSLPEPQRRIAAARGERCHREAGSLRHPAHLLNISLLRLKNSASENQDLRHVS